MPKEKRMKDETQMRNRCIDFVRGVSIILIVIYHVYAISAQFGYGPHLSKSSFVNGLASGSFLLECVWFLVVTVIAGWIATKLIDDSLSKKITGKKEEIK